MEKFSRSKSSRESGMQKQPTSMNDLRSYSTSAYNPPPYLDCDKKGSFNEVKIKKSGSKNNGFSSKSWSLKVDPEFQRKKRVASYKAYEVEGKMKGSVKKSFRWIKDTCNQVIHGIW
ncbi:uncharacterized protein LOC110011735 [Sesamum indicum]|uniref:Uncharacterized protein LOC110011734 n=1 Tax=Sesamum indicum TaxID=4182 RepID=A0A8M8UPT0_SESIN|nr:uncharacterized protein LOC110011734 [Sesamum indicum]XP_020548463.1 uncharacterized protein LOC110011735 [Sesamum indicum]